MAENYDNDEIVVLLDNLLISPKSQIQEEVERLRTKFRFTNKYILGTILSNVEISEYKYSFKEWNGELPPPLISDDNWVDIDGSIRNSDDRLREVADELSKGREEVVYCLLCDVCSGSLKETRELAIEKKDSSLTPHEEGVVKNAPPSDISLYIGETTNLPNRLVTHVSGKRTRPPKASILSSISKIKAVGILDNNFGEISNKYIEYFYAINLATTSSSNDDIYVCPVFDTSIDLEWKIDRTLSI